jgi:nucleotide-binding universal stress UspA family protein
MVVVVGVDEFGERIVQRAIEEARRRSAELHAVHVFHFPLAASAGFGGVPIDEGAIRDAQRKVVWEKMRPLLEASGVRHLLVDLEGYPPDTLVEYARNVEADLLVVGTRGRGDLASLILGSTSHRAIQLSPVDVLVVKG